MSDTKLRCDACGSSWASPEDLRSAAGPRDSGDSCSSCGSAARDVDHISRWLAPPPTSLRGHAAPVGWATTDGEIFLAHFRQRRDQVVDSWKWLTLRLWPVSAGLLVGALIALWPSTRELPELEGEALGLERSLQARAGDDLLADVLSLDVGPPLEEVEDATLSGSEDP